MFTHLLYTVPYFCVQNGRSSNPSTYNNMLTLPSSSSAAHKMRQGKYHSPGLMHYLYTKVSTLRSPPRA